MRAKKKYRRSIITPISDSMPATIKNIYSRIPNIHPEIWSKWYTIAGKHMYTRTFPQYYNNKTLVVGVTNSAWLQELTMLKFKLLERIENEVGKNVVKELRLVIDSSIGKHQWIRQKKVIPKSEEPDISTLSSDLSNAADKIDNKELALAIKKAAAANLSK